MKTEEIGCVLYTDDAGRSIFIVPAFQMDNQITQGVLWGLLSAFTYAIFVTDESPFFQQISGNTGVAL